MLRIGPYTLRNPYILAPMAGVSEMPFRRIALELGASLAPTELVSAAGLVRQSSRTRRYLCHDPEKERPFSVQLFGGEPREMSEAAHAAREEGAQLIDINMGCPVPKVTRNGAGSALLCDTRRAAMMVESIRVSTGMPVTVKIRAGWDRDSVNAPEVACALEDAGACALAIHPRTRAQGYSGHADWSLIARVRERIRIPLVGNGDVWCVADARRMMQETGCDAVMVGRAALGYPWIFRELCGGTGPTPKERGDLVRRHFDEHVALHGETIGRGVEHAVRSFRRMLLWYARGLRGAVGFRSAATVLADPDAVRDLIDRFFTHAQVERASFRPESLDVDYRQAYG